MAEGLASRPGGFASWPGGFESWQDAILAVSEDETRASSVIPVARSMHAQRAAVSTGPGTPVARVEDLSVATADGPLPVRVYRADEDAVAPVVLFAHGGGWALGSLETHDSLCRSLCAASGWTVVAVDYRLAPEHRYPAAHDDLDAALAWVTENAEALRVDATRIAVAGDSAGGNLAAGLCVRHRGDPRLRLQVLFYPALDGRLRESDWRDVQPEDLLQYDVHRWFLSGYAGSAEALRIPEVSPVTAPDLAGLAPAVVLVGARDGLVADSRRYVDRLVEAGVPATLHSYEGMEHGFVQVAALPERAQAIEAAAAALRSLSDRVAPPVE